ncbi:MAG: FG-GAP repeat protein [Phycisphaerales bacterium]
MRNVYTGILVVGCMLMHPTSVFGQCEPNEVQKLFASDGDPDDHFGWEMSIWKDTAIIGVPLDDDNGTNAGSAYVYQKIRDEWVEMAKLLPAEVEEQDRFGVFVSIFGDTILVSATADDDNGSDAGAVYVFEKIDGVWIQIAKLLASDGEASDRFGSFVSIFGETISVGAQADDDNGLNAGAVYVFEKIDDVWIQVTKLLASDGEQYDELGRSGCMWEDTMVIGAIQDDDLALNSGAAYVFEKVGGVWQEVAKLTAADGGYLDELGWRVSVHGDTALIGAHKDDENGFHSGSAYVFERVDGKWKQTAKLLASDGEEEDTFGFKLNVVGNTAIVGAWREGENKPPYDYPHTGAAYVFHKTGSVWAETEKLTASDADDEDRFGVSVSIHGDSVLVGAYNDDDNGEDSGAIYVIDLNCVPPCPWDLDGSGSVGASDLLALLVSWGPCKGCPADFDGNGTVGASDLLALLVNWGPCP